MSLSFQFPWSKYNNKLMNTIKVKTHLKQNQDKKEKFPYSWHEGKSSKKA